jgi:FkbM family methyltransferase
MNLFSIQKYFTPTSILDIGANVGDFAKQCSMNYPMAKLFLVEGNAACEPHLKRLKCEYFIGLLSDEVKTVQFYVDKNNELSTGNSMYRENTQHFSDENIIVQELQTNTLDEVVQPRIFDLIKIDVQGSELDVLRGGINTVNSAKGIILELSLIEYNKNAPSADELIQYMESIDYVLVEKLQEHFDSQGQLFQWDGFFVNRKYYGV